MPPTDDDARDRILGEVQALRGELPRLRDRAHARDLKRRLIALYLEAATLDLQLANEHVSPLIYEAVGAIIRTMGTAAWDEPETVEEAKARMRTLPAAPGSIAEMFKLLGNPMLDEMLGGDPDAPRPDSRVPGAEKPWHERTGADAAPMIYGRKDALPPPTLTDKELDRIVRQWENGKLIAYVCGKCGSSNRLESDQGRDHVIAAGLPRLVAEFRRLRSDPFTFIPMLTDKELETIDALIQVAIPMTECKSDKAPPKAFARLISEHRRLRSDDWLQAAAVEVSGGELARLQRDAMIAILRKHRDGKA